MARLGTARLPEGLRLYAIGDVHGERAALEAIHARIAVDLMERPARDWRVVHLGDLIDPGPDSAGVLALIAGLDPGRFLTVCGNHDAYMREFLADPEGAHLEAWLYNGGDRALLSFGLAPEAIHAHLRGSRPERRALHAGLLARLPAQSRALLDALPDALRFGDFGFVHAGIRPGRAWEDQATHDLHWIRDAFLESAAEHEVVVVHGHTPVPEIEVRPNRLNLDTGAGKGGHLSCVVIEGASVARLDPAGPAPLAPA